MSETPAAEATPRRPGVLRRMYDWVGAWAERPSGEVALGVLSFAESSFFPVPPDVLLIGLAVGRPRRALRFALVCSLASVVGGLLGYYIGSALWSGLQDWFFAYVPGFSPEQFAKVQDWYTANGAWPVFIAAFTPIPYKIFTIASGVMALNLPAFLLASAVGRSARFFLVAGLIYRYGASIQQSLEKHFDRWAVVFVILLVGGFLAVKLLH